MKKIFYLIAIFAVSAVNAQDYSSLIQSYLSTNKSSLGLQQEDIDNISISSQSFSKSMGLDNVYVSQMHQGIEISGTSSSFAVKNGAVINANITFENNVANRVSAIAPGISPRSAINKATNVLNLETPQNLELLEQMGPNAYKFSKGGISLEDISVKLKYQPTESNLTLTWEVGIYLLDGSHHYFAMINAITGELVHTYDLVLTCNFGERPHAHTNNTKNEKSVLFADNMSSTAPFMVDGSQYNVFPLPAESPDHGDAGLVVEPANEIASPFGWHDTDGAPGPEFTITRGNNVYAQDDIDGDNGTFGDAPDGTAALDFNFPQNTNTSPRNNLDAATVNLFYMNNVMHDIWYQYGFDEASGNFQENNYDNGGANGDGDFVIADAQDGTRLNNATFGSNIDGGNGRMNMFLWSAPPGTSTPLNILNGSVADEYEAAQANFGAALPPTDSPVAAELSLVLDDNSGESTDENDGCDVITNGTDLTGTIAVLRRGTCQFGFKVLAAENEGAVAAIVVNNEGGDPINMSPGDVGGQVTIPAIMVSQADGEAIIAALENGESLNAELSESPPFQKDGSLDNGVIAHEYGHGISTRLTAGRFNSGCLQTCTQTSGGNCVRFSEQMGEGWSDWVDLMITIEPGDEPEDRRGIGTYVTNQSTTGTGIRNFPYSTDFSINPVTYADVANTGQFSAPHGVGSIWASMIWDLSWRLIEDYGFDPDLYNGTGGNNLAMQLVIDAMKLQPCQPGFEDARDAILQADELANGGANRCRIWETFAARGLGASADQGSSLDRTDGTEAFDVPSGPDCTLATSEFDLSNNFSIYPNPTGGDINISTLIELGDVNISIFDVNGRKVLEQELTLQSTTTIDVSDFNSGVYLITIKGDTYSHTAKIIVK